MNCQKKENPPVTSPKNSLFTSVEKHKLKETCEGGSVRSYMLREPSCTTCRQHVWSNQTADEINSINMLCILQGRKFLKNNWKKYEPCNYRTKETIETSWRLPGNHQLLEKITGICWPVIELWRCRSFRVSLPLCGLLVGVSGQLLTTRIWEQQPLWMVSPS